MEGHITLVNPAAQTLLERTEQQVIGRNIQEFFTDPLPQHGSERLHSEVRSATRVNFHKTFRVRVSELSAADRGLLGYVYTLDDLTETRRLEREVRMQDRLAAVGRLAAAIAHEIRNPLTSIAGSVSLLTAVPDLSEEHRQLLQIVTRESERLNGIITDFLAYSRGKQYRFVEVDLIPLLDDTLTLLEHRLTAENASIHVERHYESAQAWTLADGDKLKQVFWNFCENAVRAMRDAGGTLRVSLHMENNDWQIIFADTGPGMRPQLVEKIFEPFQSEFEGGTGLGLAIVYQIVQAHEGKVWARSKFGQGSEFVLRLRHIAAGENIAAGTEMTTRPLVSASSQAHALGAAGGQNHG
jgi:two-component system sensor histidine kinase PilS (NtrC family)